MWRDDGHERGYNSLDWLPDLTSDINSSNRKDDKGENTRNTQENDDQINRDIQ